MYEKENVRDAEIAGGWRMLCASVLWHAIETVADDTRRPANIESSTFRNRRLASKTSRDWVTGGDVGLVTFDECCEMIGIPVEQAREKILEYARKPYRKRALKRDQYREAEAWAATR